MIAFVRGILVDVNPEYIVVDVNGVGYQILCPNPFAFQQVISKEVTVYTHQYVREDILALYGFQTKEEKRLFTKLIQVSGIGPKGALAILASGEPMQVVQAIENGDEKYLVKFPGVGKKTASQMILDLKGKLDDFMDLFSLEFNEEQIQRMSTNEIPIELQEAIEALKVLGYVEREINKCVQQLKGELMSTDQYVKRALQILLNSK